jgi:hemerythrin-like metal-binding protein
MALIDWEDSLSVGVASIDGQHRKLVDLINKLNDAMKLGKARDLLGSIFNEVIEYTAYHFSTEEDYMERAQFAGAGMHALEHKQLVNKVLGLQKEFAAGKVTITVEVMNFLRDWVAKHILTTDKKYSAALIAKGIK